MKKKISLLLLIVLSLFIIVGCDNEDDENLIVSNNEKVDVSEMEHQHCTRAANAGEGIEVRLDYDIYYKGDSLLLLKSVEKVITDDKTSLDTYENAYNSIKKYYEGLDYYDHKVVRNSNSVTNSITINYEKIDIDALVAIEGEEDNIIEDGVAKVSKWRELGKKFGVVCNKNSDELEDDLEKMEEMEEQSKGNNNVEEDTDNV